jgi:lipopolysaccharide export system permease protein
VGVDKVGLVIPLAPGVRLKYYPAGEPNAPRFFKPPMKLINRYIFKAIFHYFSLFLSILVVVLLINEIYDSRDVFLENNPAMRDIILFLLYSLPAQMAEALPMIGLLATIFAYGLLAKGRELLAMGASGTSFWALAVPGLIFGLGLTAVMFGFNETVVPICQTKARYLEKVKIGDKPGTLFTKRKNLFVKGAGNRFYNMEEYLSDSQQMIYPTILELSDDGSGLLERIEADHARLMRTGDEEQLYWEFSGAERWTFNPDGTLRSHDRYAEPFQLEMEEKLDRFLSRSKKPEEMNFWELKDYRDLLVNKGGEDVLGYSTALHQKLTLPLACLLMPLLGFAVVADVHARKFTLGVSVGLVIAIGFFIFNSFLKSMGEQGEVAPVIAGWLPIMILVGILYYLMRRLDAIRG